MAYIAQAGGQIKYGHSEVGNFTLNGMIYEQNEIEFLPVNAEDAADQLMIAKWIIRNLAYKHGYNITFAPKITTGKAGSGLHIHMRIMKDGQNQMLKEGVLSETARKAIAGMMELAPSITAFGNTNPTSYFRLVPHQEAPTNICWGDRNRSVLVRVPLGWAAKTDMCMTANPLETESHYDTTQKQTVEMRSPDGSADLYQLIAGLAVACRHGFEIENALDIAEKTYVNCRKPYRQPDFAQFQLGNLEPDTLTAWFDFPFNRFWLRQRYGLLLSIVPFLFALSFGLLILRREKRRQRNHLLTEKQLIFIHDLKTPFCTSCHIEQHLLQHAGEWPAEKIHEKLNVCRHLLAAITDEMTQLIDRSAGYWGTNPETAGFDLRSMLEEVAARYGGRGDASRIAVDYRLDTPIVQGDSFHLSHIIGNLIDNALRHAGPEANVTVICDADRRGRLRLTVEDNGTGIPRRLHRRIFRPGFRSVPTGDNHGIGLAYIRNTARRIGARLRLDSRPGHGSRFILTFTPGQKHRSRKIHRSEERRVGKECRSRWSPYH